MKRIPKKSKEKNSLETIVSAVLTSTHSQPGPDIREDKVTRARERAREGFYFNSEIYDVIAEKLLQNCPEVPMRVI